MDNRRKNTELFNGEEFKKTFRWAVTNIIQQQKIKPIMNKYSFNFEDIVACKCKDIEYTNMWK